MSASRLTTPALEVRTPIHGLLLAGQDVTSPGIAGAVMGGLMTAAVEPALLHRLSDGCEGRADVYRESGWRVEPAINVSICSRAPRV